MVKRDPSFPIDDNHRTRRNLTVNSSIEYQTREEMVDERIWGVPFGRMDQKDRFLHPLRLDERTRVGLNLGFLSVIED